MTLAAVLQGVISQRLVPTIDGKRTAALEILVRTPRIEQLIIEDRDNEIRDAIEEGKEIYGSQSFDQGILDLWKAKRISTEQAFKYATSPADLKLRMEGLTDRVSAKDGNAAMPSEDEDKPRFADDEIFELKA